MKNYLHAYIGIIGLGLTILTIIMFADMNPKPKTLPKKPDTTYVDYYHVDSTGKYLLRYNGDTVR